MTTSLHVLIVGFGSIGQRHACVIRELEPEARITVWRSSAQRTTALPAVDKVVFSEREAIEEEPDLAIIASPATAHMANALPLVRASVPVFIEKPLAATMDHVDELLDEAAARGLPVMVGYVLRFFRPLKHVKAALQQGLIGRVLYLRSEVGQYLPRWRPESDYRDTVSARRRLGGGALRELSHELDYVQWLLGLPKSVSAVTCRLSHLDIDVEDLAEIIMDGENWVASIHLDMIRRPTARTCCVVGSEGTVRCDLAEARVDAFVGDDSRGTCLYQGSPVDFEDMYREEMHHFLECVRERRTPVVDGAGGKTVLKTILAAEEAAARGRSVAL